MKYDLVKFHHWLLVSTFRNKWFEENIKFQIISLISWFIYPDFRKSNSLFSVLKQNRFILTVFLSFILWTSGFFTFGKLMNIPENTYKYIFVDRYKEKVVPTTNYDNQVRMFIEDVLINECDFEHKEDLKKLPDNIFFFMLQESRKNDIPFVIFFKVVDHESGFQHIPNSSGSGAFGYCQIMPSTYNLFKRQLGVSHHTPISNIQVGCFLLKDRFKFHKDNGSSVETAWFNSLVDYAGGKKEMAREILGIYKKSKYK